MKKNRILPVLIAVFLLNIMVTVFNLKPVFAQGTIYIRPDGTVDPPTAAIQRFNDLYLFTADVNDSVVIQKDNITIDGNGYRLQGTGTGNGLEFTSRENVTILNMYITGFGNGIVLVNSPRNKFFDNTITYNAIDGVYLSNSFYNVLISNIITYNYHGLNLYSTSAETVHGNIIANNYNGINMFQADGDFSGNLLANNSMNAVVFQTSSGDSFVGNTITNNYGGIGGYDLGESNVKYNMISDNSGFGMDVQSANYDNVVGNTIQRNGNGISFWGALTAADNVLNNTIAYNDVGFRIGSSLLQGTQRIYHNNFFNNTKQVYYPNVPPEVETWDNGYPSGGNFWSDYNGTDYYNGPYQNLTGSDGIGDIPYLVNAWQTFINKDKYPLMSTVGTSYVLTITATTGGTTDPPLGAHVYTAGSVATVSVNPQTDYVFDHWELDNANIGSTNPISVAMNSNHALHAVFNIKWYMLTITDAENGQTDPLSGVYSRPAGSSFSVTAIPDPGYQLSYWDLDSTNVGSTNPISITMETNHTLHAVFNVRPTDVAVTRVLAYPTIVRRGQPVYINVTVQNLATFTTAPFNVVIYADKSKTTIGDELIVATQTITDLTPSATRTLQFIWDTSTVPQAGYYISAEAIAPNDVNEKNNLLAFSKKINVRR